MRILVFHNYYQQAGGEDEVFRAQVALLREHGHEVSTLTTENGAVHGLRGWLRALRRPPLAGEGRGDADGRLAAPRRHRSALRRR